MCPIESSPETGLPYRHSEAAAADEESLSAVKPRSIQAMKPLSFPEKRGVTTARRFSQNKNRRLGRYLLPKGPKPSDIHGWLG